MSTQVSLRLDDRLLAEVDKLVRDGEVKSRAALVESALERELRRRIYAKEAEIYAREGEDPELTPMFEWMQQRGYPRLDD